jgi:hypothetical protein
MLEPGNAPARHTLLYFGRDFELLSCARILGEIGKFSAPDDHRRTSPELRFIPFAKSGAGDLYCFFLNETQNREIPIVLVWHDMNSADFLAKNLQDFMFRGLLEAVMEIDTTEAAFRTERMAMFQSHRTYLSEAQQKIIMDIYARAVTEFQEKLPNGKTCQTRGLLGEDELQAILQTEAFFERLNQSFEYQQPEPIAENTGEGKERINGCFLLTISPVPQKLDKVSEKIKALNWRPHPSSNDNQIVLQKKTNTFISQNPPVFILEPFQARIQSLRESVARLELVFLEDGTKRKWGL